jgi:hypothetical protein
MLPFPFNNDKPAYLGMGPFAILDEREIVVVASYAIYAVYVQRIRPSRFCEEDSEHLSAVSARSVH